MFQTWVMSHGTRFRASSIVRVLVKDGLTLKRGKYLLVPFSID